MTKPTDSASTSTKTGSSTRDIEKTVCNMAKAQKSTVMAPHSMACLSLEKRKVKGYLSGQMVLCTKEIFMGINELERFLIEITF